jgi:hypothetical protein
MSLLTEQPRPAPADVSETGSGPPVLDVPPGESRADPIDVSASSLGADAANDPDDIAAWYPAFLATFLLALLGLGGFWAWNFAI